MPHQCTTCLHTFEDGATQILEGCPDCGGKKFQFKPTQKQSATPSEQTESPPSNGSGESSAQHAARSSVADPSELPSRNFTPWPGEEPSRTDTSESIPDDEVPPEDPYEREAWEQTQEEKRSVDEIRRELNRQFESIRILAPGEYEVNLMELYEKDEYIIALQEDGQYMIEVPGYLYSEDNS